MYPLGFGWWNLSKSAEEDAKEALRRKADKKKRKAAEKKRRLEKSKMSFALEDDEQDSEVCQLVERGGGS